MPVDRDPREQEDCPPEVLGRASDLFEVKVACDSPWSFRMNIGDLSDPDHPIWRPFYWIRSEPPVDGCGYHAADSDDAVNLTTTPLRLSKHNTDPPSPSAPSDFDGEATLDVEYTELSAVEGEFTVQIKGDTVPADCSPSDPFMHGLMSAIGPVQCGDAPMPPTSPDCDFPKQDCSPTDKMSPGTKFGAWMLRLGHELPLDALRKLLETEFPEASPLIDKIHANIDIALVSIGKLEGPGPKLIRKFLFIGSGASQDGWSEQYAVAYATPSPKPMRLSTGDPDSWLGPSDFESDLTHAQPATLAILGGHSQYEDLTVNGMTFNFKGLHCIDEPGRIVYGEFHAVRPVWCGDISWWLHMVPRDCSVDCPPERQGAGHKEFAFKVGRASEKTMPLAGRKLADHYGCQTVAAYVNIGTEGADAIHRRFLFVGHRDGVPFDVAKGNVKQDFWFERHLATGDPDSLVANSDFSGKASLDETGELNVDPSSWASGKFATPYSFKLPGAFEPGSSGNLGASGWMIPLSEVECGEAPEPTQDTSPDDVGGKRCEALGDQYGALFDSEVEKLSSGEYNDLLDAIPEPDDPDLRYPNLFYQDRLETLKFEEGRTLRPAVFVGKSVTGEPVVCFVDMYVRRYLLVGGVPAVEVVFVSDPCAFDEHGKPILVAPRNCVETLPYKGMLQVLHPTMIGGGLGRGTS